MMHPWVDRVCHLAPLPEPGAFLGFHQPSGFDQCRARALDRLGRRQVRKPNLTLQGPNMNFIRPLFYDGSIGVSWWEMVPVSDGRGKDGDGR